MSTLFDRLMRLDKSDAATAAPAPVVLPAIPVEPDRAFLIRVLRDNALRKSHVPNFKWDYSSGETCAMGLARRLWPEQLYRADCQVISEAFAMEPFDGCKIFCYQPVESGPGDIADLLEQAV